MVWTKGRQLAALSDTETTMSFKYDCNGIRTKKTVNGVETKYTYVGSMLVSQKTGNEVINFAYTAGGAPYGFTYNGQSYFYLLNLQGDVIGIYDGNGNVVVEYTYDSWGKLISVTGSLASTIGIKNPLRYRGYYYDTETSLYYLQSRYYDPETCRFINADSLLVAGDYLQGTNLFAYCLNNPVVYFDHTGYEATYSPALLNLCEVILSATIIATMLPLEEAIKYAEGLVYWGVSSTELLNAALALIGENTTEEIDMAVKRNENFKPRKDSKKGSKDRQPTGARERNVGHKNGEEHSRTPKGNGVKIHKAVATGVAVAGTIIIVASAIGEVAVFVGRTMAFGLI